MKNLVWGPEKNRDFVTQLSQFFFLKNRTFVTHIAERYFRDLTSPAFTNVTDPLGVLFDFDFTSVFFSDSLIKTGSTGCLAFEF